MVTLVVDREELSIPTWVTDIDAFRRWLDTDVVPEHARMWFLNGEVWVDMSKEQLYTHADVKAEITSVLRNLAKAGNLGRCFPDGILLTNRKELSVFNFPVSWEWHDSSMPEALCRR
jgi:hypothetical protein